MTGASGGVGTAAVQLARARGADVVALTSPEKAPEVARLGAQTTLNRQIPLLDQLDPGSIDLVIDLVAGAGWPDLLKALRSGGRYASPARLPGCWWSWTSAPSISRI